MQLTVEVGLEEIAYEIFHILIVYNKMSLLSAKTSDVTLTCQMQENPNFSQIPPHTPLKHI